MILLVFAHRGEAQTFLKSDSFQSNPLQNNLYQGEQYSLLISGEGHNNVVYQLAQSIALIQGIERIINLGICGAFSKEHKLGEVISLRSVYGEDEFKSFQSCDAQAQVDLITTKNRVLKSEQISKLDCFAPLVDREAWTIGLVAKEANIPCEYIKLVSDHITDAPVCEVIRENAGDYSDALYREFLKRRNETNQSQDFKVFSNADFYFTVALEREVKNLIKQILVKNEISEDELFLDERLTQLYAKDYQAKKRAQVLRDLLKEILYPIRSKINNQLSLLYKDAGFNSNELIADPALEREYLNLKSQIKSQDDIDQLITKLSKLKWSDYQSVMNGEKL